VITLKNVALFI